MKAKATQLLILAAALFTAMTAVAEPLALELESATAGFDQRIGQPVLNIKLLRSQQRVFAVFSSNNVGRKMELRVGGKALHASVIREPLLGGSFQISGISLERVQALAEALSKPGTKVEIDIASD
jgi:preprotein translocase subunit SecD